MEIWACTKHPLRSAMFATTFRSSAPEHTPPTQCTGLNPFSTISVTHAGITHLKSFSVGGIFPGQHPVNKIARELARKSLFSDLAVLDVALLGIID